MSRYVIDTTVPTTAAGGNDVAQLDCQIKSIAIIKKVITSGTLYVDADKEILTEYKKNLQHKGRNNIGKLFYIEIYRHFTVKTKCVKITKISEGNYTEVPSEITNSKFDPDDRKFIAVAKEADAKIYNATDSDYLNHETLIRSCGIEIEFVCGCDETKWFTHERPKKVKKSKTTR